MGEMRYIFVFIIFFTGAFSSNEINIHKPSTVSVDNLDDVIIKLNTSGVSSTKYNFRSSGNEDPLKEEYRRIGRFLRSFSKKIKNRGCRNQFLTFLEGLQNSSIWAVQMFDASSKIPSGLAAINTYHFGNYDECLEIFVPKESLRGKYCLAKVGIAPKRKKYSEYYTVSKEEEFSLEYDPVKPVWDKFKVTKDPSKKRRDVFYSGVCIPNKCSAKDVEIFLTNLFKEISTVYGYEANITVEERSCDTNEPKEIRGGAKAVGSVILFFVISVFMCTVWDVSRKKSENQTQSNFQKLMESFSLPRNLSKLIKADPTNEMDVFHGMKALSMMLILLGHRCVASYGGPFRNPDFLEKRYREFIDMLLLNGTLIVDTFFMIGGYLTFIGLTYELEIKKKLKPTQVYLYRWLRITPVYMLVVFFYGYILEHLGNGPYWATRVGREAERCRENWWTNFFYINNYVNTDKLCMFQSWYVTCDMHYVLIAPILINIIWKNPKKGLRILGLCIFVSILIPFITTYWHNYDGVLRVYMSIFEDLSGSFTFSHVYIKTHNRAIPYFIGMAAAYIYLQLKVKNYEFSRPQTWILSFTAAFFALSSIFGAYIFYIPGRRYDPLENAVYACFHRVFWASSIAFVAIAGGRRAFGIIQPVLSHSMYTPLSRLSYGAFLVHGAIQLYTIATLRGPEHMCYPKLFWMTAGDVVLSFFISLIIHLFIEAPVGGIQKLLLLQKKICAEKAQAKEMKCETTNEENFNSIPKLKEC